MHFHTADETPEVLGIFRDQNSILFKAAGQNRVVLLAAPSHVERMKRVNATFVKTLGKDGRQAFVYEELHASSLAPGPSTRAPNERIGIRECLRCLDGLGRDVRIVFEDLIDRFAVVESTGH